MATPPRGIPILRRPDAASGPQALRIDEVFNALDGTSLTVQGDRWLVEVYSVTDERGARWVQLGLRARRVYLATVKMARTDSIAAVSAALADWLTQPMRSGEILCLN